MGGKNTWQRKVTETQTETHSTKTAAEWCLVAGWGRPRCSGRPDDLAEARTRRAESRDKATDSIILAEEAGSGAQDGEGAASGEGGRDGRSLAAEGATAHAGAAVPHNHASSENSGPASKVTNARGPASEYTEQSQGVSRRSSASLADF